MLAAFLRGAPVSGAAQVDQHARRRIHIVSLHRWRRFPGEYLGLDNYVQALDSLAYVLFFWLALGAMVYGLLMLRRLWMQGQQRWLALSALIPTLSRSVRSVPRPAVWQAELEEEAERERSLVGV